jgi:hypothetical protein
MLALQLSGVNLSLDNISGIVQRLEWKGVMTRHISSSTILEQFKGILEACQTQLQEVNVALTSIVAQTAAFRWKERFIAI